MTWISSQTSYFNRPLETDMTQLWVRGIKVVLSMLILTILTALAGGVVMTFIGLEKLLSHPLEIVLREFIVNTLILLAIVEPINGSWAQNKRVRYWCAW